MAQPGGFEPPTVRLEGGCSIQLSYGCIRNGIDWNLVMFGRTVKILGVSIKPQASYDYG